MFAGDTMDICPVESFLQLLPVVFFGRPWPSLE